MKSTAHLTVCGLLLAACSHTVSLAQRPAQPLVRYGPPLPHTRPFVASRSRTTLPGAVLSVTCYLPTGHRTASGSWPRLGMAAGNRWPLGTRLWVQRVGVVTVMDRIGWGSDLDLFMTDQAACERFGRRYLRVWRA